ncbi:MAG: EAL domain-containing protein [Magnetococcales bacterium]|nr:EAL domain-containing protein [Magnetococcales bacterium]
MKNSSVQHNPLINWSQLIAGYFLAALLGQWDPLIPDYASAIWPPAGVALAGLLLLGRGNWPGVWLGGLAANLFRIGSVMGGEWLTPGVWLQAGAIATGSTLAAWLGTYLITRFVSLERLFFSERQILAMLLLGGPVSCLVSALLGPIILLSNGIITPESLPFNIFTWWIGDTIGVLLFTPLILIWSPALGVEWKRLRWFVTTGLLLVLAVVATLLIQIKHLEHQRMANWLTLVGGLCFAALLEAFVLLVVGRDILTRNQVQHRTAELEETKRDMEATAAFQRAILDSAYSTIISTDAEGIIRSFNNAAREQLGYEPDELIGIHTPAILHDPAEVASRAEALSRELGETVIPGFEVFVAKARLEVSDEHEWSYIRKDGSRFPVSLTVTAMRRPDGTVNGFLGIGLDITRRKQDEARLALAHMVIENTSEAIMVTNDKGLITYINNAFEQITGWSATEVVGGPSNITKSGHHDRDFYQNMWKNIYETGCWSGEIWDRRKNGEVFPKWLSISAIKDASGQLRHFVGIFTDITQKKEAERNLERLAYYDPLTGLPNRALFRERMEHAISIAMRHKSGVALFFIDLDRFKLVNDTMGHAAGDELLKIVADRIQTQVRRSDTAARLGGDEFTVILTDVTHPEQVSPFAQKIIDSLQLPMTIQNQEVKICGSIGIALYPGDGEDFDTLTRHADMAMYLAKERGRNNFQFFSEDLQARILERVSLETDLGRALENREFLLHYQPKFDARTQKVVGMESLVRWEKPGQGLVSPARFIPAAEETGLILSIGEWILETSCHDAFNWRQGDQCPLQVAVNLSARQFQQPNLIGMVRDVLDKTGLPPVCLELEITESMLMGNVDDSVAIMRRLRDLGISLAMDDFGTGYSSLSYLKKFPVNTLKIDQAFVRELRADSSDASIVMAIIGLARALNLKVVAEGVENAHQLAFLQEHGCDLIQGFYLAKPMPSPAFASFVREHKHTQKF